MARASLRAALLAAVMMAGGPPVSAATDGAVVLTQNGPVKGLAEDGVGRFLGIPYAAPPIGDLRWRPPRPAASWTEPRPAFEFADHCAQNAVVGDFSASSRSEDCLYLNVFAPSGAGPSPALPVMVWLPGGGFTTGESDDYDGSALVKQGNVIVVTLNYRLGILGSFASPSVRAQTESANYGLLDQQFAMQWVQHNIAAFGGDPQNVTVFGESAGADATLANVLSPGSKSLLRHAIIESSAYLVKTTPLQAAQANARGFAEAAGCPDQSATCLRGLTVAQILKVQAPYFSSLIIDGVSLPEEVEPALRNGRFNHVDIINGTNHEELRWYLALARLAKINVMKFSVVESLREMYHDLPARIADTYKPDPALTPDETLVQALTDGIFACPARRLDRWASAFTKVFAYEFADSDAPQYTQAPGFRIGTGHTSELQYIFPGFHGASGAKTALSPAQARLSDDMIRTWTNFARSGNPSGEGTALWPAYQPASDNFETFGPPGPGQATEFAGVHHCQLWDD